MSAEAAEQAAIESPAAEPFAAAGMKASCGWELSTAAEEGACELDTVAAVEGRDCELGAVADEDFANDESTAPLAGLSSYTLESALVAAFTSFL